jgi:hypothetical protein
MPFIGKASYSAGQNLPEVMEDVSDLVGIVSPFETPLLDHLGDSSRTARSTIHEWIEDELLSSTDVINQTTFTPDAATATSVTVANGSRFRSGDMVRVGNSREVIFINSVSGNTLTVVRRYGNSPATNLLNGQRLTILANGILEGDDMPEARFTNRQRRRNFTQIFAASVSVSGTMLAARQHGVTNELEYQKQNRIRELLRDLEASVISGYALTSNQAGTAGLRRSMNGLVAMITTNNFLPGSGPIPPGGGTGADLTEELLNAALRVIWESSSSRVDTIVVGGLLKRRINSFLAASRQASIGEQRFSNLVSEYESDYGVCKVVLARSMPPDAMMLLDSSRVEVMALDGRAFGYKAMGSSGDREQGMVVGEYTVELRNELAHGVVRGLT